jgi:hypothetical protein
MQPHEENSLAPPSWRRPRLARVPRWTHGTLASASGRTLSNQEMLELLVLAFRSKTSVEGGIVMWRVSWRGLLDNPAIFSGSEY